MKSIELLLVFLTISLVFSLQSHHKKKENCPGDAPQRPNTLRKHKIHANQEPLIASDGLPSTPKAMTLKNHFGADPNDSPYGPQTTLVRKEVSTLYPDGTIHVENQTEIIHLPEGVLSDCDISMQRHYALCFNLNTCDLCAASPYCGI